MIRSALQTGAHDLAYDIVIVGSGPAGIVLAAELADAGFSICVLESGAQTSQPFSDALRKTVSEGITVRESSRERIVGGASKTWTGTTAPLDPIDFEKRELVGCEGWPIGRDELVPYYTLAAERYGFPPLTMFEKIESTPAVAWKLLAEKIFVEPYEPMRFGQTFRHVFDHEHLDLITDATVIELVSRGDPGSSHTITALLYKTSAGLSGSITGRVFVLAAGGIENPRILLNSTAADGRALGNEYDQVGRHFMNHPKGYVGDIRFRVNAFDLRRYMDVPSRRHHSYAGLRLPEATQEKTDLLNSYIHLVAAPFPWQSDPASARARAWVHAIVSYARLAKRGAWRDLGTECIPFLRDTMAMVPSLARLVMLFALRVSYGSHPKPTRARVRCFAEMAPDPENRIMLSDARDALGVRIPLVRHILKPQDIRSIEALLDAFAKESSRLGIGEFTRSAESIEALVNLDASHHLGATRMGRDPRTSVVDPDLRMHSIENLYIAGGSVFPTSGNANPTYTVVALSIRLAAHLRRHFLAERTKAQVQEHAIAASAQNQ